MSQFAELPDGTRLEFPDDAPVEVIQSTVKRMLGVPESAKYGIAGRPNETTAQKVENWFTDARNDIKHGSKVTAIGRVLAGLGAKGTDMGVPEQVGDFMASPALGALQVGQGAAQMGQGRFMEGSGNVIGGALDASQIPGAFMGGEGAVALERSIPSKSRAVRNFTEVMAAAHDAPVDTSQVLPLVQRALELHDTGTNAPSVVQKLAEFITNPGKTMDYRTGRDFASASGRLSAEESAATKGEMKKILPEIARALDQANGTAAASRDMGAQYASAMDDYRRAMAMREMAKKLGLIGVSGAGLGTSYKIYNALKGQ